MGGFETGGWHWPAFFLGPIWYLSRGMTAKGMWLLILCLGTFLLALPFVCFYSGTKGKGDWYNFQLRQKSRIDLNKI
jgi:hypothetical protein